MGFGFEDLEVYDKAMALVNNIYIVTRTFPKDEMFGLTSQFRRAAVSVALNIAEGTARSKKDFSRFVDMARGSVFECVALSEISLKQKYINKSEFSSLRNELTDISKMLSGLKKSLRG